MWYLISGILGSMIGGMIFTILTKNFDNVRWFIVIFIGIPLGAFLGLLTANMIKTDSAIIYKNIGTIIFTSLLYFIGGILGSAGSFFICNLLMNIIVFPWGGMFNIVGIFVGGVLGIFLVKRIRS